MTVWNNGKKVSNKSPQNEVMERDGPRWWTVYARGQVQPTNHNSRCCGQASKKKRRCECNVCKPQGEAELMMGGCDGKTNPEVERSPRIGILVMLASWNCHRGKDDVRLTVSDGQISSWVIGFLPRFIFIEKLGRSGVKMSITSQSRHSSLIPHSKYVIFVLPKVEWLLSVMSGFQVSYYLNQTKK